MRIPKHPTLIRRLRDARVKQLVPRRPPLAASLGHNAAGGAHVTLKVHGKTRTVYYYSAKFAQENRTREPKKTW